MRLKGLWWSGFLLALPLGSAFGSYRRLDKAVREISEDILKSTDTAGVSVAVMPFQNPHGEVTELGRLFGDGVTDEMVRSRRFMALDRNYISKMLAEIKLGYVGLVDPATAIQVGKFSGARYLLLGTLEPYGKKEAIVQARLLETQTAQLVATARTTLKLDSEMRDLYGRKAVLDAAVAAAAPEGTVSDEAVSLNQSGPDGCRWVEARAQVSAGSDRTISRASAIALARQKAVRRLSGQASSGPDPDFKEQAFQGHLEQVLRTLRSGRIQDEKIVEDGVSGENYKVALQDCLQPVQESADKDFRVELMLNQNRFLDGQEARSILTCTRDAYVYLYSVGFDQNVLPVYPVAPSMQNRVEAGRPFIFPSEEHQKAGIRLLAQLPPGTDSSIETLRVVAVKQDAGSVLEGAKTYPDLIQRLQGAGMEWAEDVRVFAIYRH